VVRFVVIPTLGLGWRLVSVPAFNGGELYERRWCIVRFCQMIRDTLGSDADSQSPLPESETPEPAP
jgi:hypothetical protein